MLLRYATMIERSTIEEMFDQAKRYRWSIEDPCVWSFFFAGHDREALLAPPARRSAPLSRGSPPPPDHT